jgi:hypothetical protein
MTSSAYLDARIGLERHFASTEAIQWNLTAFITAMPKKVSRGASSNDMAGGARARKMVGSASRVTQYNICLISGNL